MSPWTHATRFTNKSPPPFPFPGRPDPRREGRILPLPLPLPLLLLVALSAEAAACEVRAAISACFLVFLLFVACCYVNCTCVYTRGREGVHGRRPPYTDKERERQASTHTHPYLTTHLQRRLGADTETDTHIRSKDTHPYTHPLAPSTPAGGGRPRCRLDAGGGAAAGSRPPPRSGPRSVFIFSGVLRMCVDVCVCGGGGGIRNGGGIGGGRFI